MNTIERLDFTGPPPGLRCDPFLGWPGEPQTEKDAAWALYMAGDDPPGMRVYECVWGPSWEHLYLASGPAAARAAAWAWYKRRVKLADAYQPAVSQGLGHLVPTWPSVLGWTDEQVAAAEACLIDDEVL